MTDNEINKIIYKIDSLHRKILDSNFAEQVTESEMLSLILAVQELTRQKVEIERLQKECNEGFKKWKLLDERTKERYAELYEEAKEVVKTEARKEFAERLKKSFRHNTTSVTSLVTVFRIINDLLKEMESKS